MTYPPNIVNSASSMTGASNGSRAFYMNIEGTLYGPYTADLMQQYVSEGRIGPQSLLSTDPSSGYKQAQYWPEYSLWGQQAVQSPKPEPVHTPLPSVFFIIADIHSDQNIGFLKKLQGLGKTQRLSETVWIMSADVDIDSLRDQLSQTLTSQDRLFIHDTFSNRAGWFNIGEGLDETIRDLWVSTAQKRKSLKNRGL